MAMTWQSFSRPKPPRTGASHIAEAVSELLQEGHTRTLRVIFQPLRLKPPSRVQGKGDMARVAAAEPPSIRALDSLILFPQG